jgi:DNA-binding transcriptional MerR regulator
MFTEQSLRDHPAVVKALIGLPAEAFWQLVNDVETRLPAYEQQRLDRPNRRRALGGGRPYDQPLVIRLALVLTYLRLHIPQEAVARLYGATQSDVSRELRRLLPVLREVVPTPEVWEVVEAGEPLTEADRLELADLADQRALIDATEQRVYRSQDSAERKRHYSGKKSIHLENPDGDGW